MQLNPHQPKYPSSNLEPGLPLLIGTSTGGRSIADQQEDQFAICHARYPVQGGDIWLLCSDGLTASLDDAALGGVLGSMVDLAAACDRLVHAAVADALNDDNITVALLRVRALGDGVQELS